MRKLMWFSVGFAMVCAVCSYAMYQEWLLPAAMITAIGGIIVISVSRKQCLLRPAIAVLTGCLAGLCWFGGYHLLYLKPVTSLDGQKVQLTVTASDYSYDTGYGSAVDGVTDIGGKYYRTRIYLQEQQIITPGDQIDGIFRVRLTLPDEHDRSLYHQGNGIFLLSYQQEDVQLTRSEKIPVWCCPAVMRSRILSVLERVFPEDTVPFVKALLLGDSRNLDYGTETAFKISGIRHVIAVSGLHVSMLFAVISLITVRRRFLTAVVGMPVLLLFAAVAGFTPSVTRACIMAWLMLLAAVFDREYDSATALSFAVLVMLMVNPMAVTSVSLQLSVGCVAGILLFNTPVNTWLKGKFSGKKGFQSKLVGSVCSSISVTLSAMTIVTPLSAYYFGTVSLIGVLTNLLTLWVINAVFVGLILICISDLLVPGVASFLAMILAWPVRYILLTAKTLAAFPLAAVYMNSIYFAFWLIFVYVLLTVFLAMEKKRPGMLLCCSILGLCVALLCSWTEPLASDTRITMLDVGQGQSILLQSEGKTFLVDCGGDSDEETADLIAETLLSQGIRTLDGIVLTHYDRDHAGGLHHLLTRVDASVLFLPDTRNDFEKPQNADQIVYVWEDVELSFGPSKLQIYGPVYSGFDNENSLCVLFDTEKCDILITGDRSSFGERMLLRRSALQDVDILVAGHHGAADSASEELLNAVRPETVLISVAQDNIYGHPAASLLQRLESFGCAVFRTDQNGTIIIRR